MKFDIKSQVLFFFIHLESICVILLENRLNAQSCHMKDYKFIYTILNITKCCQVRRFPQAYSFLKNI